MDPYEFAMQQKQVAGAPEPPADAADLMDLLVKEFGAAGHVGEMAPDHFAAVLKFADFANAYLDEHRIISTGVVNGVFSLVFDTGVAVPLASGEPEPERPDRVVPITMPRDSRMKGMPVVDNSVQITTGQVGSPVRRPQ